MSAGHTGAAIAAWQRSLPLLAVGAAGVVAGGLTAAAVAHDPGRTVVWLAAYLVLVVGVVQFALGAAQAWLVVSPPGRGQVRAELVLFNAGNLGVIAGTLRDDFVLVLVGTGLVLGGLTTFLVVLRRAPRGWIARAGLALVAFVMISAIVGLYLSATAAGD